MSTTSTFTLTRQDLVKAALRKVGNVDPAQSDLDEAVLALNVLVKRLDEDGKWLWAISQTETPLTLSSSVPAYVTGTDPGMIKADILDLERFELIIGTYHIPCIIVSSHEAARTYLRDSTGQPLVVYLEKKADPANNVLWTYPVPTGSYNAVYKYRRRLYEFTSDSDNPDMPQAWSSCLIFQLANDLAYDYHLPLDERQLLEQRAEKELRKMQAANQGRMPVSRASTEYF